MRTPAALLTTAALAVGLAPVTIAPAAAATDWRQSACKQQPAGVAEEVPVSGTGTVVSTTVTRVRPLAGVKVVAERLDFSGVTCDLLYVTGTLPAGARVTETGYAHEVWADLIVGDVQQDPIPAPSHFGFGTGWFGESEVAGVPRNVALIDAVAFRAVETGTIPDEPGVPTEWKGDPYTITHLRTDWRVDIAGSRLVRKTFTVTAATKVAAERRLQRQLRAARTAAQRQAARKTYRLALRGIKLVRRKFDVELAGSKPR